jgi:hypothetical protein
MNSCACPASSLTSVAFAHGVVMQRCRSHELQSWTVNGRRTDAGTVRGLLKDLFIETRGQRRSTSPIQAQKVVHLDVPSYESTSSDVALDAGADERLTALLRSRGLQGSWAVASS